MLTTAACPEASRNRRPSAAIIQHPSPRAAMGKVFLKWRGKSPLLVGMRYPGKDCSRVENGTSAVGGALHAICAWLSRLLRVYWHWVSVGHSPQLHRAVG